MEANGFDKIIVLNYANEVDNLIEEGFWSETTPLYQNPSTFAKILNLLEPLILSLQLT